MTPPVVLTIAGSDPTGGAGIAADLKTFAASGAYGASVITAVTVQHTRAVLGVHPMPPALVGAQLDAVLDDLPVAATKVGMVATVDIAEAIAARARAGRLPYLVLDPVLTASTGGRLGAVAAVERLLPHVTVLTPNCAEASELLGRVVRSIAEMGRAAEELAAAGPGAVVVTGGDRDGPTESDDVMWVGGEVRMLRGPRVRTRNTHGTGCTFSSAVAARLAFGDDVADAVAAAKRYVCRALVGARDWQIGAGAGPVDHFSTTTFGTMTEES